MSAVTPSKRDEHWVSKIDKKLDLFPVVGMVTNLTKLVAKLFFKTLEKFLPKGSHRITSKRVVRAITTKKSSTYIFHAIPFWFVLNPMIKPKRQDHERKQQIAEKLGVDVEISKRDETLENSVSLQEIPWVPLKNCREESEQGKLYYQERLYDCGPYKFLKKGERYLDLVSLESSDQGRGFGTLCYRKFIQEALSLNFKSHQIITSADKDSHLFHFYMGMQPESLNAFATLISRLLTYFRANPGKKLPVKNEYLNFGCYTMTLSEKGFDRWKESIGNETPFKLFKDLSHLKNHLLEYRKERERQFAIENEKLAKNPGYQRYKPLESDYPLLEENALDELCQLTQKRD